MPALARNDVRPLAPGDPLVDSTLDRDTRLSVNTATAVAVLGQFTAEPGTVVVGPDTYAATSGVFRYEPLGLLQAPLEVVHVAVVVDERARPREPAAVDDAGVVERIRQDEEALRADDL